MRLLYSIAEASKLLGLSPKSIRRRIDRRQLPFCRLRGRVFIPAKELEIFIANLPGINAEQAIAQADKEGQDAHSSGSLQ
jgi:excisionase family DNA binding protein